MEQSMTLRVVVFQDGGLWVAQGLEYDIGAQAESLDEVQRRFILTLKADLEESLRRNGEPFAGIDPAPQRFHDKWEQRTSAFTPPETPMTLPDGGLAYDMALCA